VKREEPNSEHSIREKKRKTATERFMEKTLDNAGDGKLCPSPQGALTAKTRSAENKRDKKRVNRERNCEGIFQREKNSFPSKNFTKEKIGTLNTTTAIGKRTTCR